MIALEHQITIAQLRWSRPWVRKMQGMQVEAVQVLKPQFGLLPWISGLVWASRAKPVALKTIWHDVNLVWPESNPDTRSKLLSVMLTTLRLAACLEHAGIEHIRNRFLFGGALSAMWLSRLLQVPYSLTVSMGHITFPLAITRKTVREAAFCVVPTREMLALTTHLRGCQDGIHLIKTGIHLDEFGQIDRFNQQSTRPLILAVGRLVQQKGFDTLVQACAYLRDWGIAFDCTIVGSGSEQQFLRQQIRTLHLERHVTLSGALPFEHVKHCFRKAAVMVVPSRVAPDGVDGLPNVIPEALAMGVPIVATAVAAIPELIIDNQTGLLVEPDNPAPLAGAIRRLLEDENLGVRLARAGNEQVRREFDITRTVQQLSFLIGNNTCQMLQSFV